MNESQFQAELTALINRHSIENGSDTPDYLLAEYLSDCLATWNKLVKARDRWWNFKTRETIAVAPPETTKVKP